MHTGEGLSIRDKSLTSTQGKNSFLQIASNLGVASKTITGSKAHESVPRNDYQFESSSSVMQPNHPSGGLDEQMMQFIPQNEKPKRESHMSRSLTNLAGPSLQNFTSSRQTSNKMLHNSNSSLQNTSDENVEPLEKLITGEWANNAIDQALQQVVVQGDVRLTESSNGSGRRTGTGNDLLL